METLLTGDTKYTEKSIRYCSHSLLNVNCEQTAAGVEGCDTGLETLERAKGRPVRRRGKCNTMMKCKYFCDWVEVQDRGPSSCPLAIFSQKTTEGNG